MTFPWDDEVGRQPEGSPTGELELSILQAGVLPQPDGAYRLLVRTSRGDITGLLHVAEGQPGASVMVGGASGGVDGPAGKLYERLGRALIEKGVTTLRLDYRLPNQFDECVVDVLAALSFLKGIGAGRVVLAGHSFGGAVVIRAGELSPLVSGVVAMSSQLYGTDSVADLAPRPLLLVHGMEDQVLEATASDIIYQRAAEPKQLVLYPGAGHSLIQCQDELFELLSAWIPEHAAGERSEPSRN